MWDEFVSEEQISEIPEATRKVFLCFLNRANRAGLHPLDWRRFYEFVRYAHARRAKLGTGWLYSTLVREGFNCAQAERLCDAYEHGRNTLAARCPAVRGGRVYP